MSSTFKEEFAGRLNEARIAQHLSLSRLSRLVEVPKATIQGWLNGSHLPTPALRPQYLRLVEALGLTNALPDALWLDGWSVMESKLRRDAPPYLGLRPFGTGDVDYYYGRRAESRRLALAIAELKATAGAGILVLLGPSGCGKTSLLAAGLIGTECADGELRGWRARHWTPSSAELSTDFDLLVVDQLEDVLLAPAADREAAMRALAVQAESRIVVVGLRSDAFAAAQAEPVLMPALSRPVLVSPLTRDELRETVVGPAALVGVDVDPELVTVLLNDLEPQGGDGQISADLLPLLSNALLVTWAAGRGDRMTLADYRKAGGVSGAVEALAEQVYGELDEGGRSVAKSLFLRLVEVSPEAVLRRSLAVGSLDDPTVAVLGAFVAARLLTADAGAVRISHDALLRHWTRLRAWIDEHRSELESLARLRRAADLWRDSDRDPDALIPVKRLPMFTEWLDDPDRPGMLGSVERDFLQASEQHFSSALDQERLAGRRLRRHRRLALGLSVVTTLAAVGAGASFYRSEGFRIEATTARNEAQSRQVAVSARSLRAKSPNAVAQMALVSASVADTKESRSIVLDAAAMDVPLRWTGVASAVLAVSPDQSLVARGDGSGKVTLWSRDELMISPGRSLVVDPQGGTVLAIALAEVAGRQLLAVGGTNVRSLWDVTTTPELIAELESASPVTAAAFNPQGSRLAFGDDAGGVLVYRLEDPAAPGVVASVSLPAAAGGGVPRVTSVALDRAGRLYAGGAASAVQRWQLGAGAKALESLPTSITDALGTATPARVQALALTPDGTRLAAGVAGTQVFRWRLPADAEPIADSPLTSFGSWINALAYSADGARLGVASSDQTISVFDSDSGAELRRMVTSALQTGVGFAAGGRPVAVGTDGTLLAWPAVSPLWRTSGTTMYNLATDGERWLAGGTAEEGIVLWRLGETASRLPTPEIPKLPAGDAQRGAVAVAPNGTYLVGATLQGRVLTWPLTDAGAGAASVFESGSAHSVIYATVSPDSRLVATMESVGSQVALFRADERGQLTKLTTIEASTPQLVGFDRDSRMLAIAQANNSVALYSLADPAAPVLAGSVDGLASLPTTIALAPASQRIAIGESSGQVTLWDLTDASRPVQERSWHDAASDVYALAFSPDEQLLLGSTGDDLVWGWRLDSAATEADFALNGEVGRPWDVRFIDGGRRFAVSGGTGAVRVWDARTDAAKQHLCAQSGTQLSDDEWRRYLPGIEPRPVC